MSLSDAEKPLIPGSQQRKNSVKAKENRAVIARLEGLCHCCCKPANHKLYFAAFAVIVALAVGGLMFSLLETPNESVQVSKNRKQHALVMEALNHNETLFELLQNNSQAFKPESLSTDFQKFWDIQDSTFFSLMVITTLGVSGHFPKTPGGQLFCAFYALVSIPIMGLFLMLLGRKIVAVIGEFIVCCCHNRKKYENTLEDTFNQFNKSEGEEMSIFEFRQALIDLEVDNIETDDKKFNGILLVVDIDGDEQIDIEEFKVACALVDADLTGPKTKHLRVRIVLVLGFCWCCLGAFAFSWSENWKITESIYFTVTTLTAIGLGDYSPQTTVGVEMMAVFVLCGLGIFSTMLTILATHYNQLEQSWQDEKIKKRTSAIGGRRGEQQGAF